MTSRPPPPGRPPRLETYRPSDERTGRPPGPGPQGYPPQGGHPPQGYGPPPGYHPGQVQQGQPGYPPQGPGYPSRQGLARPPMSAPPREPRAARPAAARRGAGAGSVLRYGLLGLVAMVVGAAAFAVMALPAGFVRDRAIAAVKERTGRDLVIAGPASFTLYPSLGISLADVSLSGAPGFEGGKPLVAMKALDVSVAFWPLIRREVEVKALVLRDPVFHLEVDAGGRRSWDFAAADARRALTRLAQSDASPGAAVSDAPSAVPASGSGALIRLSDLTLDDVRIENGALHYHDQRTGSTSDVSAINVKLALATLAEPLNAEGNLAWKGRTVSFNGALTSLADVLGDRPAKLNLTLGADVLDATFEGSASLKDAGSAEGILSAKSASARALLGWFGSEPPPSEGFGALTAKGLFRVTPAQYTFTTAEIVMDRTTARGEISLDTRGARPLVNANLKLTELDLNTYASRGEARRAAPPAAAEGAGRKAQSIEDLLEETAPPGPRVKGYTQRDGWSEEPFDLDLLGALDANTRLSIGKLTVRTIHLDQSDLTVALKNRVMTTTLDEAQLYEGKGRGTVILDGSAGAKARLATDLALEGVEALPLLKDAAGLDRLAGKGRLTVTLTGQGTSERELVETLAGKVDFAFSDGAVIGVNVAEMVRGLGKGKLDGLGDAPTDKTDFSELTSTWAVKQGIAENQDLKLVGPLIRLTGSGRVALPAREVDYVLRPKLVASLEGQGGAQDLSGIEVPVRMHGPWDDPKFTPDLGDALKDPDKAVGTIKEIGKQLKGKKADEIVNELLGGDEESRENAKAKGKKLLEQFLNQQ